MRVNETSILLVKVSTEAANSAVSPVTAVSADVRWR